MAHIFKHPEDKSKGIIVFTHKEMKWFFPNKKKSIKTFGGKILAKKYKEALKLINYTDFSNEYNNIRKRYFIGVHIGGNPSNIPRYENCDFYMASNDFEMNEIKHILKIPLAARNFLPKFFKNRKQEKYWDVLCIAHNTKYKNLDKLLRAIKELYEKGYNYKVLLVTHQGKDETSSTHYTSLMDDYYRLFSYADRQNFTILRLSYEIRFPGLSYEFMAHLYNSSKVFTLFSQVEGAPKAVHEALCCGLPIVVKKDLYGGGRDYLTDKNSVFFDDFENAPEALMKAVKNYDKFQFESSEMRKTLGEEFSIHKLHEYFGKLYAHSNQDYDGNLINTDRLSIRLNGHLNEDIPWAKDRSSNADIQSEKQFKVFLNHLK